MSKADKVIQKMRNNPRDWKLDSLEIIAKRLDIRVRKSGGSHVVFMHDNSMYDDTVERCRLLKKLGTNPFVMFNIDKKPNKKTNALRRWANRKWAFWSCDIDEYKR